MGNTQACDDCTKVDDEPAIYSNLTVTNTKSRAISLTHKNSNILNPSTTTSTSFKQLQDNKYQIKFMGGIIYTGEIKNNLRDGKGIQTWLDGTSYQGMWKNDKMNGEGLLKSNRVDCEGRFVNNNFARGTMIVKGAKKQTYKGELKDHLYHGNGELFVQGKGTYVGSFNQHVKEGLGIVHLENGDYYEGEFHNGVYNGQGLFRTKEFEYIGQFANGKFQGEGQCKWTNGNYYKGSYVNWTKEGYGEYRDQNGKIYKGLWKSGKPAQDF